MFKLLPVLVNEMGDAFPELKAQQELIGRVMKEEEDSFLRTLDRGINLLNGAMDELKAKKETETPWPDDSPFAKCANESPWPMATLDFAETCQNKGFDAETIRRFYRTLSQNL